VKLKAITNHKFFRPALGAALTILCGAALWSMNLGERWINASYDYLFRLGTRNPSNNVVVILMDNDAYNSFGQKRGERWDRSIHAGLLNRLAHDRCPLVVFDVLFQEASESTADRALIQAMHDQRAVVLMANITSTVMDDKNAKVHSVTSAEAVLPAAPFLQAARTNWGLAQFEPDSDSIVRRHWPFPAPHEGLPTLAWKAATLAGAQLSNEPQEQWLRYYHYGDRSAWTTLSYRIATNKYSGYFRDKIVFIGNDPATPSPLDHETDEFSTPMRHWTRPLKSVGGVELHATAFLNLVNHEWLRRFPAGWDVLLLLAIGGVLGGGLAQLRPAPAVSLAAGTAIAVSLGAVCLSYFTNYWFPWLIIAGGQVPCALAVSLVGARLQFEKSVQTKTVVITVPVEVEKPETPDYELFEVPFGEGAYGKVWLAKNAVGQWQALKTVYLARFATRIEPYDREFNGIRRYKPISDKHPGLLRVDFVSMKKDPGYFYYVMELADSMDPGWETNPRSYRPRDLDRVRKESDQKRLPFQECARIGVSLTAALEFLHKQGLTHRDIKPRNILFVRNQPKLGDVGLVADIRPADADFTLVGTPGYMPPAPEPPGTVQADIYGLGMVLYVILTGNEPEAFPEVGSVLVEKIPRQDFIRLNSIILKACQPDRAKRYATVAEMHADLAALHQTYQRAGLTANI